MLNNVSSINRRDRIARLVEEIQLARTRTQNALAKDYSGVLTRIRSAYADLLVQLDSLLREIENPNASVWTSDDAVRRLQRRLQDILNVLGDVLHENAEQAQQNGYQAAIQAATQNAAAGGLVVNASFNTAFIEQLESLFNFVDDPVFREKMAALAKYHTDAIINMLVIGIAEGENPRTIVSRIRTYFFEKKAPMRDMLNLVRTLNNYTARIGTRQVYEELGVERWMWSANIGNPRTCFACIAMHGTLHPISEYLNDHHSGRCAMVPMTELWEDLGMIGIVPRYDTGLDWFRQQPPQIQRGIMGPELYSLWQQLGFDLTPEIIVGTYTNDLFGDMRHRNSNAEIIRKALMKP
ncbi:MAG: hypothetical protein OHK0046_47260 [Anaerolineae bacterium]